MSRPAILLTSYDMYSNSTKDDFDSWTKFVSDNIDERCGFRVEVNVGYFGESGSDQIYNADDDKLEVLREVIPNLWDDWCAENE